VYSGYFVKLPVAAVNHCNNKAWYTLATKSNVEATFDKSQYCCQGRNEPATRTKSTESATLLLVRSTLSPVLSTFCIFMSTCWSSDVVSVKWQTIKTTAPLLLADYVTTRNGLKNGVDCGL